MMSQFPANPEVVVIGAGAAGIGAGVALLRQQIPFVIIEAKQRVGGRAYSETSSLGHLWDHGCHWFHSADRNVLRAIAEKIGHGYRKEIYEGGFMTFAEGNWHNENFGDLYVMSMLGKIAEEGGKADISAASLLDPGHRAYRLVRHLCQVMSSQDPENISARDSHNYFDTHVNLAVRDGYGALVARLANGLPIRLSTVAQRITVTGTGVSVETDAGTMSAKACILAVPARMMERNRIAITPVLPPAFQEAFQDVPMGYYEKIAFAFDKPVLSEFGVTYADILDDVTDGLPSLNIEVHPFGRPILVSHLGGSDVAHANASDLIAAVESAVVRAFGSDVAKRIVRRTCTSWTADPYINGAYSCAKPGKAHQRAVFGEPVHDRLFLAGEHTHTHFFATAHGAYETGHSAAAKAARLLGRPELADNLEWLPPNHL